MFFDISDCIANSADFFRLVVGDSDTELLLKLKTAVLLHIFSHFCAILIFLADKKRVMLMSRWEKKEGGKRRFCQNYREKRLNYKEVCLNYKDDSRTSREG